MDAYRAEVAGIYGCVAFTNDFLQTHNITQAAATMACDCLSALRNIFDKEFDRPSQAHYDIVHACRLLLRESPATWTPRHVYGHQDDHHHYHELDKWEQFKVDMDTMAKATG
jgi:hypothetical protein